MFKEIVESFIAPRCRNERRNNSAVDGSLSAQHDPGLPGSWRDEDGRIRILRAQASGPSRFLGRGRTRTGARLSQKPPVFGRGDRLAGTQRPVREKVARATYRAALYGRRACDAGGDGVLCKRADLEGDCATAPGAAGRNAAD